MTYLQKLTTRLTNGLSKIPDPIRKRHAEYLRTQQNEDGGFSGREGGSDLYYTGFALRGLSVLDELSEATAELAGTYLQTQLNESASVVEFYSLLYSCLLVQLGGGGDVLGESPADWPDRVAEVLESFRTSDGGYGKSQEAPSGSTYHTFLVGMTYELLGRPFPNPGAVTEFVFSRRREDGGFVELKPMRRSGTNPTAAAIGTFQLIQGDDFAPEEFTDVGEFLSQLQSMEGGICANTRIPVADLLSTFTASWTLEQFGQLHTINTDAALRYAKSLQHPEGGFKGGIWDGNIVDDQLTPDQVRDVEYTFYGLGVMALLGE
ncbi:MAG: prenyltransferase/squalene oxidase repeat-containing protein [Gemmataceae bacterium]